MKKNTIKYFENDNIAVLLSLFVAVALLLFDGLGGLGGIRNGISYVFEPVSFQANTAGSATREYFQTFVQLGKFKNEYNDLKISVYEKEAQYSDYLILRSENEALKKQIALGNKDATYAMVNVLRDDSVNSLLIDEGSNAGIKQGDAVVVGNVFVGIIGSVDLNGSTVRLPADENSHMSVVILKAGQESSAKTNILSNGVVSGSAEGIKLENISMNTDVVNGDVVFINDSKVGGFLALGYVVGLSTNPASTYKTGFVSPILDYDNLMTIFVRTE